MNDKQASLKILRELKIFRLQQASFQKDLDHYFSTASNKDFVFFNDLKNQNQKLSDVRQVKGKRLFGKVSSISNNISSVSTNLIKLKKDSQLKPENFEKLRESMTHVTIQIENFKNEQVKIYKDLMEECQIYDEEIKALDKRINFDIGAEKINRRTNKVLYKSGNSETLPVEVSNYQNFLILNGGLNGGWDDFDHNTFTKIYKNFKILSDPEKFIKTCLTNLPGKSIENIKEHRIWYENFQNLLSEKKLAIENWKRQKTAAKNSKGTIYLDKFDKQKLQDDEKFEKLRDEIAKEKLEQKRKLEKERITKWREEKENEELKMAEKIEQEKQKIEEEKRLKELNERLQIKKQVEIYKQEKNFLKTLEQEAEHEKILRLKKQRQLEIAKNLPKLATRDHNFTIYKLQKQQEKKFEQKNRIKRLEKTKFKPKVESSFDRLTSLTKAAKCRVEADRDSIKPTVGSRSLPHRNVPTWRAGL